MSPVSGQLKKKTNKNRLNINQEIHNFSSPILKFIYQVAVVFLFIFFLLDKAVSTIINFDWYLLSSKN